MKLYGPRPVSELTFAAKENGAVCDPGRVRCEIILTGDGEALCWRAWGHDGRRWVASCWKAPSEKCAPFESIGGAA